MKAQLDCIVCMLKQAVNTGRIATRDPRELSAILAKVSRLIPGLSLDQTPAALSQPVYRIVSEITGNPDPYRKIKKETNRAALKLLPRVRRIVNAAKDPLDSALHAAVAGNIIDLGIGHKFNMEKDIIRILKEPFAVNAIAEFRKEIEPGRRLLYIGDNAGEIVFDRLLVEFLLGKKIDVVYAVKSAPVINDATMEDAVQSGMTDLVKVIETGAGDIGIDWKNVSKEFLRNVQSADVVIAKGHGNFETCDDRRGNFYFLLKAKCEMVAQELGVALGALIFKHSRKRRRVKS
jgi:damage-control phosphatase, subfamily I